MKFYVSTTLMSILIFTLTIIAETSGGNPRSYVQLWYKWMRCKVQKDKYITHLRKIDIREHNCKKQQEITCRRFEEKICHKLRDIITPEHPAIGELHDRFCRKQADVKMKGKVTWSPMDFNRDGEVTAEERNLYDI